MLSVLRDGSVVRHPLSGVLQRQPITLRIALSPSVVHEAIRTSLVKGVPGVEVADLERLDRGCLSEAVLRRVLPAELIEKSFRGGYRTATPREDREELIKSYNTPAPVVSDAELDRVAAELEQYAHQHGA